MGSVPKLGRSSGGGNGSHSRVIACGIAWTGEPDGLESMGGRVRHDLVTEDTYTQMFVIAFLPSSKRL